MTRSTLLQCTLPAASGEPVMWGFGPSIAGKARNMTPGFFSLTALMFNTQNSVVLQNAAQIEYAFAD